jgi:hypothetical protein
MRGPHASMQQCRQVRGSRSGGERSRWSRRWRVRKGVLLVSDRWWSMLLRACAGVAVMWPRLRIEEEVVTSERGGTGAGGSGPGAGEPAEGGSGAPASVGSGSAGPGEAHRRGHGRRGLSGRRRSVSVGCVGRGGRCARSRRPGPGRVGRCGRRPRSLSSRRGVRGRVGP